MSDGAWLGFSMRRLLYYLGIFVLTSCIAGVYCTVSCAEAVEETYNKTVARLKAEGYQGIDAALAVFEDLIGRDEAFVMPYLGAADAYLLKYEFSGEKDESWLQSALRLLNTAIGKEGRLHTAYFKRAVVMFNLGRDEDGVGDLKKAMEIYPGHLESRTLYLQYLLSEKETDEARKFARSSLEYFPDDPAARKYFGDIFFQEGAYAEAIEYYQEISPLVPMAPYTHMATGRTYQRMGEHALAIESFKKALGEDPGLFENHFYLSTSLSELDRLPEAIAHISEYLKKMPTDVSAMNNLALLYEQTGQMSHARLMWLKVREKAGEEIYLERAEKHIYEIIEAGQKSAETTTKDSAGDDESH